MGRGRIETRIIRKIGLLENISRVFLVMFHRDLVPEDTKGTTSIYGAELLLDRALHQGGGVVNYAVAPGTVSLTNRAPLPVRYQLDLPGKGRRTAPGHSLRNLIAQHLSTRGLERPVPAMVTRPREETQQQVIGVVRFYLLFLSGIAQRHQDVKEIQLQREVRETLESMRTSLPGHERWLLPGPAAFLNPDVFLSSIQRRMESGELDVPCIDRTREVYLCALAALLERLRGKLDDSVVKLLYRLAARGALRDGGSLADDHSLLIGIPETYLRQVGFAPVMLCPGVPNRAAGPEQSRSDHVTRGMPDHVT